MTDTDWKARAEELERECAQSMDAIAAERARAEAAEARVKEMEADRDYWKIEAEGERAKVARRDRQRLTVTDEMVEQWAYRFQGFMSSLTVDDDGEILGVGKVSFDCARYIRAALTAALEGKK